jgi:glycosyltransferase involved in cell wall biosynthesis
MTSFKEIENIDVFRVVNDYKRITAFNDTYIDEEIDRIFESHLKRIRPELIHFNHWIALSANLPHIAARMSVPSIAFLHDYWAICHRVHLMDWRGRRCPGPSQGGDCYRCVVYPEKYKARLRMLLRWGSRIVRFALRKRIRQRLRRDPGRIIAFNTSTVDFKIRSQVFRDNLSLARRIFMPSDFVHKMFLQNGFNKLKMEVLPLGIEKFSPVGFTSNIPEQIKLLFVGTLVPSKGAHTLIKALRLIKNDIFRLSIYGREDADPRYFRQLRRLSRGDPRIRFEGTYGVQQRADIYRDADIIIIPSLVHETFSLVAREALSSGKPVIASHVGALSEVVVHKKNGFLFQPGDYQALASLLDQISHEPGMLLDLDIPGPIPIVTENEHVDYLERSYKEILSHV